MNINKVSQSISSQSPDFFGSEYPLFNKFIEYYYRSQEKTGLGQNILNNFLEYLDIDKLDISILDGQTKIVEPLGADDTEIVVEDTGSFLNSNGSILIGDEVVYYENTTSAPNISLSPGISYEQVKLKWTGLANIINQFDGTTDTFNLTSQSSPISPPSPQHLIVSVYGEILVPNLDYSVVNDTIVFVNPPRERTPSDDNVDTYITYLSGFVENSITAIDNVSGGFGEGKTVFALTQNGISYEPSSEEYVLAIYDNTLLLPKKDFFIDGNNFIFKSAPLSGRYLSLYSIEAPIPSYGADAIGYARVGNNGELTNISVSNTGSGYRYEYPPRVSINTQYGGSGGSATALVNGIKNEVLLSGGRGYSDSNPPQVVIQEPNTIDSVTAEMKAIVSDGVITGVEIVNSGSGYTFTPRVSFKQPGGARIAPIVILNGSVTGPIGVIDGGSGYTTPPEVYIDAPTGENGVQASLQTVLTDGVVTSINILNAGSGYEGTPRSAIIEPTGAQVLQTLVDGDGRIVSIELLNGGSGYEDVPSVYIVDNRENGGSGATATASIFNGRITDINITNFGSGYSVTEPPQVIIQSPPQAEASVEIGLNEITGFLITNPGSGYSKAKFEGCARSASGIVSYTETGNAVFSNDTKSSDYSVDTEVKCLDSLFVKRLLTKYKDQFLPDIPELDYTKIDVRSSIKTIKDFYQSKGTSFSIGYLFKLLYGEEVTVSYPKDQIIKPSAATWSIDTILRATLVSGDPVNIRDGILTQEADIADSNIGNASALVENFISIKTSESELYELVLSEETIQGKFVVPYKTKLAEPLDENTGIITVDSTIGWPERNGEFIIAGTELVQYKEKSLNQFIECTRNVNGKAQNWDAATDISSNFQVYINKGTLQEVVLNVVGIVDAQQTTLTDTGSYYVVGDKLSVSKLGGTSNIPELTTWLYNVKKLIEVSEVTFGGVNNQSVTVTCKNPHGLLVGDQVTIYGANPIVYNGTFLVTSRDSTTVFQYVIPQPAEVEPQGNILVSVDLNKGKSGNSNVFNAINPYTTNIQNTFFNDEYVYVASTGIPNYDIGPFPGSALIPGNQRKLNRFPLLPQTISTKNEISPGPIGTWVNGTSIWSYKSEERKTFGPVTSIDIINPGKDYDASSPPNITISGGGGGGATGSVVVNGSITEIVVDNGGSGYTSSPLVSVVGGGGSGAAATAIVTKGVVSRILMNNGGSGYTSQPLISIVGGGGSGATATASVRGPIRSISVDTGGTSYTSQPDVTLSSGSGAVAQAIVQNGRIISIAIISAGSGYTTAPEVTIQGDGFGAVARATIDTEGENAGRVTNIEIINRGIDYIQGTTLINLNSVGSEAQFSANVFQWNYNLEETTTFDSARGSVFSGYNNQYGGEYAHLSNPQRLRFILGDNLFENFAGQILELDQQLSHSPILGWAFDGNPIYGPYGFSDPTDQSSQIRRMNSSYGLKTNLVYNQITNPTPVRVEGPLLSEEPAGKFIEDYVYNFGSGDLDQYNGRFCKTPDFPNGRYCYFVTIDTTEAGNSVFPYILGPSYNSIVDAWNLNAEAIQQNIPTGVVRYRDPYENVDIDVDRAPNVSTNSLTLENGDFLTFEIEDENRDSIISQDEIDDPDQILEESPLQLFDYFPKVKFDSKVDIEVETTTKFENASVDGFIIEDPGQNYQVNDILVFDNTDTDGTGVSARISRITGETVASYTYEYINDTYKGVLTTSTPHNCRVGDSVYIDYTPIMDDTNKTFVVRQLKGIEQIVVDQIGSGYDVQIPPSIIIDGNGESAELKAEVTSVGTIEKINIVNSGSGYTENPRIIISHPQIFRKSNYFANTIANENYVKINDIYVSENKKYYICGKTLDSANATVAFVAKFSELGVKEWEKTEKSVPGQVYAEYLKLSVDGSDVFVVGQNQPNITLLNAYNPDIILVKYTETISGLDATKQWSRGYAGISGASRSDNVTSIAKLSDNRQIIGGYTNTNSPYPNDGFLATLDSLGTFAAKRKIASATKSEKIIDIATIGNNVYFLMETAANSSSTDTKIALGKAVAGDNAIDVSLIKEVTNTAYAFKDASFVIDEFNEIYVTATLALKTDVTTRNSFWIGKFDTDANLIWNYRYLAPTGETINVVPSSSIDIFGDLNIAINKVNDTTGVKTVDQIKVGYAGDIKTHTTTKFTGSNIEGITANAIYSDVSGDPYVYGQTSWNRNEFIFEFSEVDTATDKTGHYTPTLIGNDATDSLTLLGDGVAKLFGKDVATPANWENAAIKFAAADVGTKLGDDWTIEFMLYKDATNSQTHSQTQQTLLSIGDATDTTGGLWLYYNMSSGELELVVTNSTTALNAAGSGAQSTQTDLFADDSWQFIGLKKEGDTFTAYVNGIEVINGTTSSTSLENKDLHIGNIPGKNGTTGQFASNYQGQYYVDNLRLRNRSVVPSVPTDVTNLPPTSTFAFAYDWVDDAWFTTNMSQYDYIDYIGWGIKSDKNSDSERLGNIESLTNTGIAFTRTAVTPVLGSTLVVSNIGYALGAEGLQSLDYEDASVDLVSDTLTLSYANDTWSSRTATVPSEGSRRVKASAVIKDRYYMKQASTLKLDNVQALTINQDFRFTIGSRLRLATAGGSFINSGYILNIDSTTNTIYTAVNINDWADDFNTGELSTEQFDELSTYGIIGDTPNDVNEIGDYIFENIVNTTPGTFDLDLQDFNLDRTAAETQGAGNLDEYAKFKPWSTDGYAIRIVEVAGSSNFIPGSVVAINSEDISFNSDYTTATITNLTGVTTATIVTTLKKVLQVTAVSNTNEMYGITDTRHYFESGTNIFVDGNPPRQVGQVQYDEYDGSYVVDKVLSSREFTYKLPNVPITDPASNAADVSVFAKSPVIKMYYGHQYLFDLSHTSLIGTNLSFSKDNLFKLEYSFNSIERIGTPGIVAQGLPNPTVKLKVDRDVVTNISYYFDPSRLGDDSPIAENSYLDIVDSPYVGTFTVSDIGGQTITSGSNVMKFPLINEPEDDAVSTQTTYSTSATAAVGSIDSIRIVNKGGFYAKLPVVTSIQSTRKIERVQINEPGTEYAVGTYNSVPIAGDGEGGFVEIVVANGTDEEGLPIPGQIQEVTITSPGKGYTTASIDIEAIEGILGPGLTGSGADLEVVIPPFGTGASIFTKGTNVGKIKKLKNNNFGYDYTHDYTLRPEITFPINAQLISTSILDSITVTNPGSGYSQAPTVVITGGGGSGATAEASIRNGRIEQIAIKDPGSGYSSPPKIELKSSFNYVVNLDLGLLQFAFPHGIVSGSEVTLNVVDTGDGAEFPLAAGALGRLNSSTTYYAITGAANSLEDDQLKLAITETNAELGDAISFVNAGTGRQQLLTSSFGAAAEANVITSTFLEGELVYQGDSFDNATATGYVSTNSGWQIGPRLLKIVNYDGDFTIGQRVSGVISKSSGIISDLKIAKGVLEIGSITKTTGQFTDDVGKPSEIIQKIQDSYYYQDFSYAVNSSTSISEWKDILLRNAHPASFKVFGELGISEYGSVPNKTTDFELTKSVELTREAVVPNIQSFALVEPIYSEFNNTEILFRQKRLTSSENILTSVVQRIDDISGLFDGVKTSFPLQVNGNNVVASADQLLIVLNGVAQNPEAAFQVVGDSIVFSEPPAPPASVKYVNVEIEQIDISRLTFNFQSGIFPSAGNTLVGISSTARFTVTSVEGNDILGFVTEGTFQIGELCTVGATGFSANLATITPITNIGLFIFGENVTNLEGNTAAVESINLQRGQETPLAKLRYSIGAATTTFEVIDGTSSTDAPVAEGTFTAGVNFQIGSEIFQVNTITQGSESTTISVTRGQLGTAAVSQQENTPIYGTAIEITNELTLSKTTGTYQSTPGLYDIVLDDVIIGAQSGVVARITATSAYRDPITEEFIEQVNISEGSSFFGLLFNRITSTTYPNVILDDISKSQVTIVDYDDNITPFNSNFPSNEYISNYILKYENAVGSFVENEFIRNYEIEYSGTTGNGEFIVDETLEVRKLSIDNIRGEKYFRPGDIIRTRDTKAEISGYNQAAKKLYVSKIGRSTQAGADYHDITFVSDAELNTYNQKFGTGCLALSKGTSPHTFVSGVEDGISANDASTYTAATGTTYDPISGELVIEIGAHSLTTSNTITFVDEALTFTCGSDDNETELSHPRAGIEQSGQTLAITAVTATTITVDGGAVPVDEYLTIPTSTEFGFGTDDFTIELWVKPNSVGVGAKALVDLRTTGTELSSYIYLSGSNVKYYVNGSDVISGTTDLVAGTWHHIALSKSSGTTKLFLDGAQEGSDYTDSNDYGSTKPITIGATWNAASVFPGYIDELRVSTIARYTANFTAPVGINQGDTDTVLLLHFDATSNGQTWTEDWSGGESFTNGEEFHNDAIRVNRRGNSNVPAGYIGNTHRYYDAANLLSANKEFIAAQIAAGVSGNLTTALNPEALPSSLTFAAAEQFDYYYGWSSAIGNSKIVIGHPYETHSSPSTIYYAGAIHIYDMDGSNPVTVRASDPAQYDYFGWSVAVADSKIVVGAYGDDVGGAAYVYDLDGTNEVKITASDETSGDNFGYAVAAGGNKVAIGAYGDDDRGGSSGSVYLFNYDGTGQQKVRASDGSNSDNFGRSVAIGNNKLVVGAPYDDTTQGNDGSVYVYDLDGTNEIRINASDPENNGRFGWSVAVGENKIVVGVPYDSGTQAASSNTGAVYVYDLDGTNEIKITASDSSSGDNFGYSVAVGEGKIYVGAPLDDDLGFSTGAVYAYDLDGTNEVKLLTGQTIASGDNLGYSVAVGNSVVVAGARYADPLWNSGGKAIYWTYEEIINDYDYVTPIKGAIDGIVDDLRVGTNNHVWDIAATYVDRSSTPVSGITLEFTGEESILQWAYQTLSTYAQQVINNDLIAIVGSHGLTQVTDTTITESDYTTPVLQFTPTTASYNESTGDMVITFASAHGLTTSDRVSIAPGSIRFTCASDGNVCVLSHPRTTDTLAYNQVLSISATTTNTITVNVGVAPLSAQYAHTFVSADTNSITKVNYDSNDCADVKSTISNLVSIYEDTIAEATGLTSVTADGDHLATITKVEPIIEWSGAEVDAYQATPFDVKYNDTANDVIITHQIDSSSRNRFFDAANLISANISAIVDKTSYDLLTRYPDLYQDMPRNSGGSSQDGILRCKTDLQLISQELVKDIRNGGNEKTVQAAKFYLDTNNELQHIRLQVFQSVYAHKRLGYYMKQAINGNLTYDNTDSVIVGDWGITNDPGQCADVQSAIDTLIDTINDIIAPTNSDYEIAADRLYFNREYIAEEAVGLIIDEFTFTLDNGQEQSALTIPGGSSKCIRDLEYLLIAIISDLQTGGNNSTIRNMEFYLNSDFTLNHVESELLATAYGIDQLAVLGEKAILNLLYTAGSSVTGDQYAAQHTNENAYRDSETPTDAQSVACRFKDLVYLASGIIAPGRDVARAGAKNLLFNEQYYKGEIASLVNAQFGQNSWEYDSFVEDLVNNIQVDLLTSDGNDTRVATNYQFSSYTSTPFVAGETVTTDGGATAEVLFYDDGLITLGVITGTAPSAGSTFTGGNSGASGTVSETGVGSSYQRFSEISNIQTIEYATTIQSLIEGSIVHTNLWTNPEEFSTNWTSLRTSWTSNSDFAPDGTSTADKLTVDLSSGSHYMYRSYNLTAYTTFDDASAKFSYTNITWDTGSNNSTQTFTSSMFVKAGEYSKIRFYVGLNGTVQLAFFDIDLETGSLGTLFNGSGIDVLDYGAIPFGDGWYRIYATCEFGFGFSSLYNYVYVLNDQGSITYTGTRSDLKILPSVNSGISNNMRFGFSNSVGSNKLVVGAPYNTYGGSTYQGSAYLYDLDGTNEVKLTPPTTLNSYAYYGWDVAAGSNTIAVSALQETHSSRTYAGAVYLYDLDGTFRTKITLPSPNSYDYFGRSIEIMGDYIFIGASGEDITYTNTGAVYVYDLDGNQVSIISASDRQAYDGFGYDLAVGNNKLVVGAPYEDTNGSSTGQVYIYDIASDGTASNEIIIQGTGASTYGTNAQFGDAVAIGNGKIAVGARGYNSYRGQVWVYDTDGTNEVIIPNPSSISNYEYFGSNLTIGDSKIVVGAHYDEASFYGNAGVVYVYDLDGTGETQFTAFDQYYSDYFGKSVSIFNGKLYAGAEYEDDRGSNVGALYVLDVTGGPGVYFWGAKLANATLGTYVSQSGVEYYSNSEFNIKNYAIELLQDFMDRALRNQLASPSTSGGFYKFFDSTAATEYTSDQINAVVINSLDIIRKQLRDSTYYTTLTSANGISVPTRLYGERDIPVGISGGVSSSDYIYGLISDIIGEVKTITGNEAKIVKVYQRVRFDGAILNGPFQVNENVTKVGDAGTTGIIYALYSDDNFSYADVEVTGGTWALFDIMEGAESGARGTVNTTEDRIQVIDLVGEFANDIPFKGYTSNATANPTEFIKTEAAVTDNTGGTLTVDTESLVGTFEKTSIIYPASSREYLDVQKFAGLDLNIGDRIASSGHIALTISIINNFNIFEVGNRLYRVVGGGLDNSTYGIITEVDLDNNLIYVAPYLGSFNQGDQIGDYGLAGVLLQGSATISLKTTINGGAAALVQDIRNVGLNKRLYLTDISGTFSSRDGIRGGDGYRAAIITREELKARVKRAFRGFDGVQTTFDLTIENGSIYLPDPEGHMLIFVNGVMQPPGAANAYTAFSDKIQFSEAPDLGASFTGYYVGKLRQLDDISFEFDSLRQSFNLKRNDVFYSLTLTDGVQSSTVLPENNIIVSLNGVLQQPGVGFELVGSRIIFSEIPRVGSTFVAFSYIGSEADVDSAEVVPPVEAGDFIDIQGEVSDREVAVIESSNSLITFDYLGSVFGQNAEASANLVSGYLDKVQVTSGGSGYSARPVVRADSISGFDAQIQALVGVANVTISNPGSGYQNPNIDVQTEVPDDWTAPDITQYGEEAVDPEIIA